MTRRTRSLIIVMALVAMALVAIILPAAALALPTIVSTPTYVPGGTSITYPAGIILTPTGSFYTDNVVTVPEAPDYLVSMTVNGVEKGQALTTWQGTTTSFLPGFYTGKVVVTARVPGLLRFQPPGPPGTPSADYYTRQALYVGAGGYPDLDYMVPSAIVGGQWSAASTSAKNIKISSAGECFNGVFVTDGLYSISGLKVNFAGNGRSDFVGYGAAVLATGEDTRLVLDKANISTSGVVRTAAVADGGANLVVKNSYLEVHDGVLPAEYEPTMDQLQMRSVPWVLGLSGNNRATNLCGTETVASYINSTIKAEGWGVLSTDACTDPQLNVINSRVEITGEDGYGSYAIGNATERFLGTTIVVPTYVTVARGGNLYFGNSTAAVVAQLNSDFDLGLTTKELRAITPRKTTISSDRFGVMFHGGGNVVEIGGGTVFNTGEAAFLDKGQQCEITVDGSQGAKLSAKNGVIFQLMEDDDSGPVFPAGVFSNPFVEDNSVHPVVDDATQDPSVPGANDAYLTLKSITVKGDLWNGSRGGVKAGPFGPPSSTSRNLVVTLDNAKLTGLVSASWAQHVQTTIQPPYFYAYAVPDDYKMLGEVTNTPESAVNNGAIVSLVNRSKWTVRTTCYLTSLIVDPTSSIVPLFGYTLTMYVDAVPTPIVPGVLYTGTIELAVE
jgi:hypothetical protein